MLDGVGLVHAHSSEAAASSAETLACLSVVPLVRAASDAVLSVLAREVALLAALSPLESALSSSASSTVDSWGSGVSAVTLGSAAAAPPLVRLAAASRTRSTGASACFAAGTKSVR